MLRNTFRFFSKIRRNTTTHELLFQKVKNYNEEYTKILEEVGEYYKIQGNAVKHKGYDRAVKALISLPYKIESKEQALEIPSIGKSIAEKIQVIIDTNTLPQLEECRNDKTLQTLKLFNRIHGVGPSQAKKWVDMNYTSIEDLTNVKLTKYQQLGLKYFDDLEQRIPRSEMDIFYNLLTNSIHELDTNIISMICGSYRRNLPTSGDIDMIITHQEYTKENKNNSDILKDVVQDLEKKGIITDRISLGKTKFMGIGQLSLDLAPQLNQSTFLHRRIDIRLIPYENYWCGNMNLNYYFFKLDIYFIIGVLYFTGSGFFNTQMR